MKAFKLNTPHGFCQPYFIKVGISHDVKSIAFDNLFVDNSTVGHWLDFHLPLWLESQLGEVDCRIDGEPYQAVYKILHDQIFVSFLPLQRQLLNNIDNFACLIVSEDGHVLHYQNEGYPQLPIFEKTSDIFLNDVDVVLSGSAEPNELIALYKKVQLGNEVLIRQPLSCGETRKCTIDSYSVSSDDLRYRVFVFEHHPSQADLDNQLNIQERKFNRILDHFHLGLLEVGEDGLIKKANPSFSRMSGYTLSELLGRDPSALLLDDDNRAMMDEINHRRQEGYAGAYELKVKTKKGETRWWLISGAPNIDNEGNDHGSVGIHWDITKQKELELNLVRDKNKAEVLADLKTQFLANMSHEIRTPLNAIVGMIRELKIIATTPTQKEYINIANIASDALLNIINDVLDYSKLEAGKLSLEHIAFSPMTVAKNAALLISDRIREKKLEFEMSGDLEDSMSYFGDPNRLQQSILNILSNAAKFTPVGKIALHYKTKHLSNTESILEFKIIDTGVGMDPNFLNRVFDKFSQADETISRKYGGSGLGLSITKSLIEMMGGSIQIDSKKHIGTTVTLTIPVNNAESNNAQDNTEISDKNQNVRNMRVLVVEDNALNRAVAQAFLNRHQINVTEAIDGLQALEIVDKEQFDLILMDIQMPTIDGIEVCSIIRSKGIQTPIVALTANAQQSEKLKCQNAGMNDYLVKPFNEDELIGTLARFNRRNIQSDIQNEISQSPDLYNGPSFGLARIKDLVGDDISVVNSIVELFVREGTKIANTLEQAILEKDIKVIRAKLHELRPNLHNMGMDSALSQLEDFRNQIIEEDMIPSGPSSGLELVRKMRLGIDEMSLYLKQQ